MTYNNWNPNITGEQILDNLNKVVKEFKNKPPLPVAIVCKPNVYEQIKNLYESSQPSTSLPLGIRVVSLPNLPVEVGEVYSWEDLNRCIKLYGENND